MNSHWNSHTHTCFMRTIAKPLRFKDLTIEFIVRHNISKASYTQIHAGPDVNQSNGSTHKDCLYALSFLAKRARFELDNYYYVYKAIRTSNGLYLENNISDDTNCRKGMIYVAVMSQCLTV